MSADTMPDEALAWEYETQIFDGSWHSVVTREHPDILGNTYRNLKPLTANRATRPAPSTRVGEGGQDYVFPREAWQVAGHFYETREEAQNAADSFNLWAEPKQPRGWVPISTFQAERARADAAAARIVELEAVEKTLRWSVSDSEASLAAAEQRAADALARAEKAERALETARGLAERGAHLARTVSQTRFRLEDGDRYSLSMFDANNMVALAYSAVRASREAQPATDGDGNG